MRYNPKEKNSRKLGLHSDPRIPIEQPTPESETRSTSIRKAHHLMKHPLIRLVSVCLFAVGLGLVAAWALVNGAQQFEY
jgi:hypothetical protein